MQISQPFKFIQVTGISSGFFRFGRFTTRGYGVIRLTPVGYQQVNLFNLLAGDEGRWQSLEPTLGGLQAAQTVLNANPHELIGEFLQTYIG